MFATSSFNTNDNKKNEDKLSITSLEVLKNGSAIFAFNNHLDDDNNNTDESVVVTVSIHSAKCPSDSVIYFSVDKNTGFIDDIWYMKDIRILGQKIGETKVPLYNVCLEHLLFVFIVCLNLPGCE